MFCIELIQMLICNNFLPVPVLAEPRSGVAENKTVITATGEARESTSRNPARPETAAETDSCGGQNNVPGKNKMARRRQSLGCFQLPFASPDFMLAIRVLDCI